MGIVGCSTTNNINTNSVATNSVKSPKIKKVQKVPQKKLSVQEQVNQTSTNANHRLDKTMNPYSVPKKDTEVISKNKNYPQISYKIPKVVTNDRHISDISFTKPNQKKVVLVKKVFKEVSQCAKEVVTVKQDLPFDEYYDFEVSVRKHSCCQKGGCDKKADNKDLDRADIKVGR
jgi:hypothetical protein